MNPPNPTQPATTAADGLHHATDQGAEAIHQMLDQTTRFTKQSAGQLRSQARALRDGTCEHIRAHPLRSVAIAAGSGMVLALLLRALGR